MRGKFHSVETLGALDGPGLRYVLFLQGCMARCLYCHNPDSWSEWAGYWTTVEEQVKAIGSYRRFIQGVTVSGGEPLLQPTFVQALFQSLKDNYQMHCAVDTSGLVSLKAARTVIDLADLLLLDIKSFDSQAVKAITGRPNNYCWEILDYCEAIGKPVWIRHVLVPDLTVFACETESSEHWYRENSELCSGAERLLRYNTVERIDVLPFHQLGASKWQQLGLNYSLTNTEPPREEVLLWAEDLFKK